MKLELVLTKQRGLLRAVPEKSIKLKKNILLKIRPGRIDKKDALTILQIELDFPLIQEEILSALPAGGVQIVRSKK